MLLISQGYIYKVLFNRTGTLHKKVKFHKKAAEDIQNCFKHLCAVLLMITCGTAGKTW